MATTLESAAIDYINALDADRRAAIQDDEHGRALQGLISAVEERQEDEADEDHEKYVREAQQMYHCDGSCEVDDGATVSIGEDGAYVQAWVYVPGD